MLSSFLEWTVAIRPRVAAAPQCPEGAESLLRVEVDRAPQKASNKRSKDNDRSGVNMYKFSLFNLFKTYFPDNAINADGLATELHDLNSNCRKNQALMNNSL